jgi:hypothetical protein
MHLEPQLLLVVGINILAIGITYGDARARISMLERSHKELRDEVKEAIKTFGEKQEKTIERLVSIEALLKAREEKDDSNK